MADKPSTLKLKVNLDCKCCYKKIQKILCKIQVEERITAISFDDKNNTVTISGPFCPQKLKQKLHCKAGKLILEITIVTSTTTTTTTNTITPPKPMEVNVNVKFDPPPKPSCGGGCCSKPSCGGCCCSKPSCGGCCCSKPSCGGCCCSKPSCGGSSCNCRIIPCRGYYPPSYGLPPFFQFTIEDI